VRSKNLPVMCARGCASQQGVCAALFKPSMWQLKLFRNSFSSD